MDDHRKQPPTPNTNPADAAELFAGLLEAASLALKRAGLIMELGPGDGTFKRDGVEIHSFDPSSPGGVYLGPPFDLPIGDGSRYSSKRHRCSSRKDAEKVGLASEFDAYAKRTAAFARQLDADLARLANEARTAARLLVHVHVSCTEVLALALALESRDWVGAHEHFSAARVILEEGRLHFLAKTQDDALWANARWIAANCQVTSDDLRKRQSKMGDIQTRTPKGSKHPEYYLPDVERAFPNKAPALVKKFRAQF